MIFTKFAAIIKTDTIKGNLSGGRQEAKGMVLFNQYRISVLQDEESFRD